MIAVPEAANGLSIVDSIEGWLTPAEAMLLMTVAARQLEDATLPSNFVEVGSYKGRSTVALAYVMRTHAISGRVFAIDPHEGHVGAADVGIDVLAPTYEPFVNNLVAAGVESIVQPILATTSTLTWSTPVSLIFIDGLHDYVNVARDTLALEPSLPAGGLIVFHDYSEHYPGVVTFVEELASSDTFKVISRTGCLIVLQKSAPPVVEKAASGEGHRKRISTPGCVHCQPLVSCVMPTGGRSNWARRAITQFQRQDYPNRELLIIDEGDQDLRATVDAFENVRYLKLDQRLSIGAKRNLACELASGEVILHWDDDDWSADWRVSYQVEQLLASGASVSGLSNVIFCEPARHAAWQYRYPRHLRPWVAGATLCYHKDVWREAPFEPLSEGEDTAFVWAVSEGAVAPCDVNTFYVATIHDWNTSVKHVDGPFWEAYSFNRLLYLLGGDARDYGI